MILRLDLTGLSVIHGDPSLELRDPSDPMEEDRYKEK